MIKDISENDFHKELVEATSKIIAKKSNISQKQAINLFKKSLLYKELMRSNDEFDQAMPIDLYVMWKNEKLTGYPVTDEDIENGLLKNMHFS